MKFNNPLRKMLDRKDEIAVLNESFTAAGKISDPGVRLLRLREISAEAYGVLSKANDKAIFTTLPPALLGMGCVIGGAVTANPLLMGAGAAIAFGSVGARTSLGRDTFDALWDLRERCQKAEKEIIDTVSMKDIAKSEKFDAVMATWPELKEKFMLAASREKVLSAEEPAAKPQTPRGDNGFRI